MVLQDDPPADAAAPAAGAAKDDPTTTAGAATFDASCYYMASGIGTIVWAVYIMPLIGRIINSDDSPPADAAAPAAGAAKEDPTTTAGAATFDASCYYMASGIGTIVWAVYIMPLIGRIINSFSGRN